MDFEKYYTHQINEPVFRGAVFQKGHGFGDVFKKFFRWIVPIVKQHAAPIANTVGKEALKSAVNIATDTIDGKDFSQSTKNRVKESLNNLSTIYGNGRKKNRKKGIKVASHSLKKKTKKTTKKRKLDIFD